MPISTPTSTGFGNWNTAAEIAEIVAENDLCSSQKFIFVAAEI
jgi:hypothetical protein